jgi:hypothetical protein
MSQYEQKENDQFNPDSRKAALAVAWRFEAASTDSRLPGRLEAAQQRQETGDRNGSVSAHVRSGGCLSDPKKRAWGTSGKIAGISEGVSAEAETGGGETGGHVWKNCPN